MSENDVFVRNNFHRLPWWVSGQMIEETFGRGEYWCNNDVFLWMVPDSISVRALRRGRKGHAGKVREIPLGLYGSTKIRKAIERWG